MKKLGVGSWVWTGLWLFLMSAGTAVGAAPSEGKAPSRIAGFDENMIQPVKEMVSLVEKYKLPLDSKAAGKAMVEALLKTADPFSRMMTEMEAAQWRERQKGLAYVPAFDFVVSNGLPVVSGFLPDSAAAMAGLLEGDLIEKIDGQELISSMAPAEVAALLKSATPGPVQLMARTPGGASREVAVERAGVHQPSVAKSEEWPASFCYVKLNGLFPGTGREVVSILRGWSEAGRFGVIVDLRGAGGSDSESASEMAGLFSEGGAVLFSYRDSDQQELEVAKSHSTVHIGLPAMVLVDAQTTGASELLAAVLSESVRGAMLIGQPTAADPLVRDILPLPSGENLYVATRSLLVGNGKVYAGREGVQPDILVSKEESAQAEFEPVAPLNPKELSPEEVEDRNLREKTRGDAALRRAVDVLLGLKALNIRGLGAPEPEKD